MRKRFTEMMFNPKKQTLISVPKIQVAMLS
jgi:hypothetical protein